MGWFAPKLDKGELLIARCPDRGDGTFWRGLTAILVSVEVVVFVVMYKVFGIGEAGAKLTLLAVFGLIALWAMRWRFVVTDRRLLYRHGLFLACREEFRLDEIEDVRSEMGAFAERIVVRVRGQAMVISMVGIDPAPIITTIRHAKAAWQQAQSGASTVGLS